MSTVSKNDFLADSDPMDNPMVKRWMMEYVKAESSACSEGCSSGGCGCGGAESKCGSDDCDGSGGCGCHGDSPASASDKVVFSDNGDTLFERFTLEVDPSHKRFAGGYQWFCRNCGQPCSSVETWFPCQEKFITVKIVCHLGCHNHWRLHIGPAEGQEVRLNS